MFPPFDQSEAHDICRAMLSDLQTGKVCLEYTGQKQSATRSPGIMLGAMVCKNDKGEKIVLKTVSGITRTMRLLPCDKSIFVGPVVPAQKIEEALLQNDKKIHELTQQIEECKKNEKTYEVKKLKQEREALTTKSLLHVFSLYSFCCYDKKNRPLLSICKNAMPPTGTGDCCEVKLLHYAFMHDLKPLSMCQVFYSLSDDDTKLTGEVYPPCDERCALVLPAMLGLQIVYRDDDIIVVNKQSGLLSVPGRGEDKQDCVVRRVQNLFPSCIEQPAVHRLDMETSGLMVLAFTKEAHKNLSRQFEEGHVKKEYEALLDGVTAKKKIPQTGTMELYFRLDVENRPHQIWDEVYGKKSVTEWKILNTEKYKNPQGKVSYATRVRFIPHTGRTHQLRLASADSHGFGLPIIGDTLYGKCSEGERLCLHAAKLSFTHPVTGALMTFESKCPF